MNICERLWHKEQELKFDGEIWFFQENGDDPFSIVFALCNTNRSRLAGGVHIGLIGQGQDHWASADAVIAHMAGKAKNMREKIICNGLHIRHDLDGMKAAIMCTHPLGHFERRRAFECLGKMALIASEGIGKICLIGGDVGTSSEDLLDAWHIAPKNIVGRPRENGGVGDTGIPTALGAADVIDFVYKVHGGEKRWPKTVSICGLGKVGRALAGVLIKDGYNLILSDSNTALYADICSDLVAACPVRENRFSVFHFVSHREAHRQAATIFVPCALHPIIRPDTLGEFSASLKAIVSPQNDEIDAAHAFELAQKLHESGIVYVPGPVTNPLGIQILMREDNLGRISYEEILAEERAFHLGMAQSMLFQAKDEDRPPYAVMMERIARVLNS